MAASAANVTVKTLLCVMGLAVMAAMTSTAEEHTWNCAERYVQPNITLEDVLGDWYVWEYRGGPLVGCVRFKVSGLLEDNNRNGVWANLTIYHDIEPNTNSVSKFMVHSFKDKPEMHVIPGGLGTYRVEQMSADGHNLMLHGCMKVIDEYWANVIVAKDSPSSQCQDLLQSSSSSEVSSTTSSA